jgi:hypothetical protein
MKGSTKDFLAQSENFLQLAGWLRIEENGRSGGKGKARRAEPEGEA